MLVVVVVVVDDPVLVVCLSVKRETLGYAR